MTSLNVLIPDSLSEEVRSLAQDSGLGVEEFVASLLAERVAEVNTGRDFEERAARGSREKFEKVMAKAPKIQPEPTDLLP